MTLEKLLELNCFLGAEVLAGKKGLRRPINLVNVMEVPDISDWITDRELILTTAYPFKSDPDSLGELIRKLNQKHIGGLAIKLNRFISEVPQSVIEIAEQSAFPIISLPSTAHFDRIISEAMSHIFDENFSEIKITDNVSKAFQDVVMSRGSLHDIASVIADNCRGEVVITDPFGTRLAYAPDRLQPDEPRLASYVKQIVFDSQLYATVTLNIWRKRVSSTEIAIVETSVSYIVMILFSMLLKRTPRYEEKILSNLLNGTLVFSPKNADYIHSLRANPRHSCIVAVIRTAETAETAADPQSDLSEPLMSLLKYHSEAIALRPVSLRLRSDCVAQMFFSDKNLKPVLSGYYKKCLETAAKEMPDVHLSIGIGNPTSQMEKIHESYREANKACDVGLRLHPDDGIYFYGDYAMDSLLAYIPPEKEMITYVRSTLGPLLSLEEKERSSLIAMTEYLISGRSHAEIAGLLYIHPKTVSYRKKKIENLLQISIDDPHKITQLLLALKLFRLNENVVLHRSSAPGKTHTA